LGSSGGGGLVAGGKAGTLGPGAGDAGWLAKNIGRRALKAPAADEDVVAQAEQQQMTGTMTQWGWRNSPSWRAAAKQIGEAGHNTTLMELGGNVPTESEAVSMIQSQGGKIIRIEEPHAAGGVSTHTFPHINYETSTGSRVTIRIQAVGQ
jgi:hypothetical protein